jgi:hypothetical protein
MDRRLSGLMIRMLISGVRITAVPSVAILSSFIIAHRQPKTTQNILCQLLRLERAFLFLI